MSLVVSCYEFYIQLVYSQNEEGILPVATLSISLYVFCRSRSDSNVMPEVAKLSLPLKILMYTSGSKTSIGSH